MYSRSSTPGALLRCSNPHSHSICSVLLPLYSTAGDGRINYNDFVAAMLNAADVPVTEPAKTGGLFGGFLHMFDPKHH